MPGSPIAPDGSSGSRAGGSPLEAGPPGGAARQELAERIGWDVHHPDLLHQCLSHRSWCAENLGASSNERLEFLGDAVLGLVVTVHLYRTYPGMPEGELAKVRASVVNSASLAEIATELGIGEALLLGKGEDQSGGREKPSILADATEAVIGAVYLDRGWEAAERLVMSLVGERIELGAAGPGGHDYKTRLQELCARVFDQLPVYSVRDEGPDHAKEFEAVVLVQGSPRGSGRGRSKKQAEQAAAREAWEQLRQPEAAQPEAAQPEAPQPEAGGTEQTEAASTAGAGQEAG